MIFYKPSSDMSEIESNSVGAVITSPPYPMIGKWNECFKQQGGFDGASQHTLLLQTWIECFRVLIPGGIACVNIGDATIRIDNNFMCYPNYALMVRGMLSSGFTPLIPIFWKKISNRPNAFLGSGFQPVNAYVSQDVEYIGIFRKGRIRSFTSEEKERRKKSSFTKEERDDWFRQVWEGIPGAKGAKKSSSWNMDIPYRLMRMYSIEQDLIVDPFCGRKGGIEFEKLCNKWGRRFIGYTL